MSPVTTSDHVYIPTVVTNHSRVRVHQWCTVGWRQAGGGSV